MKFQLRMMCRQKKNNNSMRAKISGKMYFLISVLLFEKREDQLIYVAEKHIGYFQDTYVLFDLEQMCGYVFAKKQTCNNFLMHTNKIMKCAVEVHNAELFSRYFSI